MGRLPGVEYKPSSKLWNAQHFEVSLSKFVKVVRNYAQIAMQYKEDFKMSIYSKLNSVAYLFSI